MKAIIHWCKRKNMWTIHTYKSCNKVTSLLVNGLWTTEVKPNKKSNPRGWVSTDQSFVIPNPSKEALAKFKISDKLVFNKIDIVFNISHGNALYFMNKECFVLKSI